MRVLAGAFVGTHLAAATGAGGGFDINQILGLLLGGAGVAGGWKVITLLADKIVPSRSDKRSDVEASFSVLSETIKLLSSEKAADAEALKRANTRIHELEESGDNDYDLIRVLKDAKDDLERRISQKDAHIATLTQKLGEYGARVVFDGDGALHIDASKAHTGPIPTL